MEAFAFNETEEALLIATGVLFIIQQIYYWVLYNRINSHNQAIEQNKQSFTTELPPISVIIYAHDEADNLRHNLKSILEQDYPQFEVIVVTDGNADDTDDYLTMLRDQYPHLYHSFVPGSSRYISHKKLAVTLGIKASKYNWLVFTDANCQPQSNQWLKMLARNFTPQTQIVLGYSNYERGKSWLHKRIAFDNLFTHMRHLGFALLQKPYMGIGRNLAYRKELFYSNKGFSAHLNLLRGEDDLFVNQTASSQNTRVETSPSSIIRMQPISRYKDWKEEKIGYASTAHLYRGMQRYILGFETTTRIFFYGTWIATTILGLLHQHWFVAGIAILLFVSRTVLQALVINRTARSLEEETRYYFSLPVFDILQPLQSLYWKSCYLFSNKSDFMRK